MSTRLLTDDSRKKVSDVFCILLCLLCVYAVVWSFTGMWPWAHNEYNSYVLQADAWRHGRLDLGQNYSHLEIAKYGGKYFVSFPPFPSYVMFPFVCLFGTAVADNLIALLVSFVGAIYLLKLLWKLGQTGRSCLFWTLFVTIGSNLLYLSVNGWVWFFAQSMSFTLSVMALYYAVSKKGGLSLSLWACSVGCRPLQAVFLPVLLYVLWKNLRQDGLSLRQMIKAHWNWVIAPIIIAVSYMLLNYFRFDNILEFGHNYLPEFQEAANGQFSLSYVIENMKTLFRLPGVNKNGTLDFPSFNGMAFFIVSPIFVSFVIYLIKSFWERKPFNRILILGIPLLIALQFFFLTMHKTMGGHHFGNRYTVDCLPYLFFALVLLLPKHDTFRKFQYPLFFLGLCLNIVGTVIVYTS